MFPKNLPNNTERIIRTMRNPHQGFPWTGYSGMDLSATDKAFNSSMRVYQLPFCDASRPERCQFTVFDEYCNEFRNMFNVGDNVNAVVINGFDKSQGRGNTVGISGQLAKYDVDHANYRIRVWVRSDKDFKMYEVYPETLFSSDVVAESVRANIKEKFDKLLFS